MSWVGEGGRALNPNPATTRLCQVWLLPSCIPSIDSCSLGTGEPLRSWAAQSGGLTAVGGYWMCQARHCPHRWDRLLPALLLHVGYPSLRWAPSWGCSLEQLQACLTVDLELLGLWERVRAWEEEPSDTEPPREAGREGPSDTEPPRRSRRKGAFGH